MNRDSDPLAKLPLMPGCAPVIDPFERVTDAFDAAPHESIGAKITAKLERQQHVQVVPRLGNGRSLILSADEQVALDQLDG
jgi:hypothetical protein